VRLRRQAPRPIEVSLGDRELSGALNPVGDLTAQRTEDVQHVAPGWQWTTRQAAPNLSRRRQIAQARSGGVALQIEHQLAENRVDADPEDRAPERPAVRGLVAKDDVEVLRGAGRVQDVAVSVDQAKFGETKPSRSLAVRSGFERTGRVAPSRRHVRLDDLGRRTLGDLAAA
jgi:hypothetical protein